ncbi:PilZ domain-containing protein [Halobacillus sp. Nhm2S1]|uniref:PilZ domain-containing protein n=1 Tax=Halobacillus sp. Nhm2S1 TaxID=2866716 RepID=UPI001C73E0AD|nr:PilZ domain-containing protein [Halobacillus sp. Nhm2S1]MBX0357677.1 PilZ domain-containing protein [Halobacillus sp. Nhm2S1]
MRYKRKDYFRYEFKKPLQAFFRIHRVGRKEVNTSKGEARIINISPHGMKLNTNLDLPHQDGHEVKLSISFHLNDQHFHLPGTIVWKKKVAAFNYGIYMDLDEAESQGLVKALKVYASSQDNVDEI